MLLSELGLADEHLVGDPYGYTYKVGLSVQLNIGPHLRLQCAHGTFILSSSPHCHFPLSLQTQPCHQSKLAGAPFACPT